MLQMLWNMGGELMRGPAGSHMMPGGMTNDFAPPTPAEAPCANGECSICRWYTSQSVRHSCADTGHHTSQRYTTHIRTPQLASHQGREALFVSGDLG